MQILNNLYSLQSVNIGVNISVAYACAIQKTRHLLGHALRKSRYEYLLAKAYTLLDLLQYVVNLIARGAHLHGWIDQSRGANKLFYNKTFALA